MKQTNKPSKAEVKNLKSKRDELIDKINQLDHHIRMLDIEKSTCELEHKKLEYELIDIEMSLEN